MALQHPLSASRYWEALEPYFTERDQEDTTREHREIALPSEWLCGACGYDIMWRHQEDPFETVEGARCVTCWCLGHLIFDAWKEKWREGRERARREEVAQEP